MKKAPVLVLLLFSTFSIFSEDTNELYRVVIINLLFEANSPKSIEAEEIYRDKYYRDLFTNIVGSVETNTEYNNCSFQSGDFYFDYNHSIEGMSVSTGFFLLDYGEETSRLFTSFQKNRNPPPAENMNDGIALKLGDVINYSKIDSNESVSYEMLNSDFLAISYMNNGIKTYSLLLKE